MAPPAPPPGLGDGAAKGTIVTRSAARGHLSQARAWALSRIAMTLSSPSPGGEGSTRVQRAAGWGESLSLRAVSVVRLSPHPVEHLTMLADPPPPGSLVQTGDMVDGCSETSWTLSGPRSRGRMSTVAIIWVLKTTSKRPSWMVGRNATVLPRKALGSLEGAAEEADVTACWTRRTRIARGVFEGCDGLDIVAQARLIAACRDGELERLVRSLRVVDVAPAIEGTLGGGEIGKERTGQHLGLETAVEAFVLAHGLRMIGPRMTDPDAMLDQPDPERRERAARSVAPGRTVVGNQLLGQAVAAEGGDELLSDRLGLLVGTRRKHHGEARVIVQHGQRMKPAGVQSHMAFEVHLPQLVRSRPLEPGEGGLAATVRAQLDAMPLQDRRYRRWRRNAFAARDPSTAWRSCGRPRPDARHEPKVPPSPLPPRCAPENAAADATSPQAPSSRPFATAPAICSRSSGSHRTDGTTAERWLLPPTPTSQTPISCPSETPRGTASDSLLDPLSKVSTMSPNTRPPCPRSEHPSRGG